MIGFDWWWGLLLLPLPALVRALVAEAKARQLALSVPLLTGRTLAVKSLGRNSLRPAGLCLWVFWICLVLAASRPFWLGDPVSRTVSGRDLMLAVDISGSMNEADMTVNGKAASRIDVLKLVVGEWPLERDLEFCIAHDGFIDVENDRCGQVSCIDLAGLCTP